MFIALARSGALLKGKSQENTINNNYESASARCSKLKRLMLAKEIPQISKVFISGVHKSTKLKLISLYLFIEFGVNLCALHQGQSTQGPFPARDPIMSPSTGKNHSLTSQCISFKLKINAKMREKFNEWKGKM